MSPVPQSSPESSPESSPPNTDGLCNVWQLIVDAPRAEGYGAAEVDTVCSESRTLPTYSKLLSQGFML